MENLNNNCARRYNAALVILSLIGTGIILLTTANYGAGLSNDSVGYIAAARSIAAGMGVLAENGSAMTVWPPLYPALLATLSHLLGADPLASARFVNALLFGLVVYLSGRLFLKHLTQSASCALFGTAFLITSSALIEHSLWALSETLFICFVLLYLIFIETYLAKANTTSLFFLSLSVALACMTRYIGVILIFTGAISILFFREDRLATRLRNLMVFITISAVPIAAWIYRNYFFSETFFGPRAPSIFTLTENIYFSAKAVQYWFLPEKVASYPAVIILLSISTLGLISGLIRNKTCRDIRELWTKIRSLVLFTATYIAFLLFSSTTVAYDQISNRLLCPIYIPIVILSLLFMLHAHQFLTAYVQKWIPGKFADRFLIILISVWLIYPIMCATAIFKHAINYGEGYNSQFWRLSPTIEYINRNPQLKSECSFYTNTPEGLYIRANIVAERSPRKTWHNSPGIVNTPDDIKGRWPTEKSACLVWFKKINPSSLFSLDELQSLANLQEIADFEEGTIYSLSRK